LEQVHSFGLAVPAFGQVQRDVPFFEVNAV